MAAPIFISYRRAEPPELFAPLKHHLLSTYQKDNIYLDVEMRTGEDWNPQLEYAINHCGLLFAVIGPNWRPEQLIVESDWVRQELLKARRRDIPVIPLLLGDTLMPDAAALPEPIRWLTDQPAISIQELDNPDHLRRIDECIWRILPPGKTPRRRIHRLPNGARFPFSHNLEFTNREKALKALGVVFFSPQPANTTTCHLIHGKGGVGKTQLTVEFAYQYAHYFEQIHWLNLTDADHFWMELAACGKAEGMQYYSHHPHEQAAQLLRHWRSQPDLPRLLIFDNFNHPAFLRNAILPMLRGLSLRIIITSRRPHWPVDIIPADAVIALNSFQLNESRRFMISSLRGNLHLDNMKSLDDLVESLEHLPLALMLAARYLRHHPTLSIADYHNRLNDTSLTLRSLEPNIQDADNPTPHDLNLLRSFKLSESIIPDYDTLDLFHAAAWCAPNIPIPDNLLNQASRFFHAEDTAEALFHLENAGLLRMESSGAVLHPLTSQFGRQQDPEHLALKQTAAALIDLTNDAIDRGSIASFTPLRPHLEAVCAAADAIKLENVSILWNKLAYHYHDLAQYEFAWHAYQHALDADIRQYGEEHKEVASDLRSLSTLFLDMSEFEKAHETARKALQIDRKLRKRNDPQLATDYCNLGAALLALGDIKKAQHTFQHAIQIDRAVFGHDHPIIARDLANLASTDQRLHKTQTAIKHYESALLILKNSPNPNSACIASIYNHLGDLWMEMGNFPVGWDFIDRALRMDQRLYGESHPLIALRLNNLGGCLLHAGDPKNAANHFREALQMAEQFFPPDHPQIVLYRQNLENAETQLNG